MAKRIVLILFLLTAGTQAYALENSRVTGVQGTAVLIRDGLSTPIAVGTECRTNDILKTDPGSVVDVSINNLAGCRILASSQSAISGTNDEKMGMKLLAGDILLNIEKLPKNSKFQVETPTAVATVRGTQFSAHVDAQDAGNPVSRFAVRENMVDVSVLATGESFTVGEGQAFGVPRNITAPLTVRPALGGEMAVLEQTSTVHTCS